MTTDSLTEARNATVLMGWTPPTGLGVPQWRC
jgi:hypothetical protein